MSPPVRPVRNDDKLPPHVDVAVVGGGIIGVCAAYYLRREGLSVALVEKGRIAGEQSSRNWGFVRQQGRDPSEIPLIKASLALWEEFEGPPCRPQQSVGFKRSGILYLTEDHHVPAAWTNWLGYAGRNGIESFLLDGEEAQRRAPSPVRWSAGLYTPGDAQAEPSSAVPAIAEAAQLIGVTIHQGCAARAIETTGGRATALLTEHGRIAADTIVCAAGAWSSRLCRPLGAILPQLMARASVLRTAPAPEISEAGGVAAATFSARRRSDGGYTVARPMGWTYEIVPDTFRFMRAFWPAFKQQRSAMKLRLGPAFVRELAADWRMHSRVPSIYETTRELDPGPDLAVLNEALEGLRRAFPQLGRTEVAEAWAGMIDIMPDAVPVIGPVPQVPNLYLATGFSGHGFGIGPGAGRLIADLITTAPPIVDPHPFRFERLSTSVINDDVTPN